MDVSAGFFLISLENQAVQDIQGIEEEVRVHLLFEVEVLAACLVHALTSPSPRNPEIQEGYEVQQNEQPYDGIGIHPAKLR